MRAFSLRPYRKIKYFLKVAMSNLGRPYIWGGDDPSGFDCSGFVIESLKAAGLMLESEDLTANGLYSRFSKGIIEKPIRGCLMFLFNKSGVAYHVEICLDSTHRIGASGGDSKTTGPERAWGQNAYVKIRPIGDYHRRKIFVDPFMRIS